MKARCDNTNKLLMSVFIGAHEKFKNNEWKTTTKNIISGAIAC